jgi:uncharacterized protein YndB with AHSA1/START domain
MAEYTVERRTEVAAPPAAIYERLVDFHRWTAWSPFEDLDPDMERTYSGADAGVGAAYEWKGDMKAGSGRMEIVEVVPDRTVVIEQRNFKPMKSQARVTFSLDGAGEGTTVTWAMVGKSTTMTRVMGIFKSMDSLVGPIFEKGLARLKADAEGAGGGASVRNREDAGPTPA